MIQISSQDLEIVKKILFSSLPQGAKIFVFGSRAGNPGSIVKKSSDLDLAIDLTRKLTRQEEQMLFDKFEESDLAYRVDFVDINNVSPSFKKIINSTKQPLIHVSSNH